LDGESTCVVSTTPPLNVQAPLFFFVLVVPRYQACHLCGGRKDSFSTLPINRRGFVDTIDTIIEDATGLQRSVHGIFAFHLFALILSSLVPDAPLTRDNGVTFFLSLVTETQVKHLAVVPCQDSWNLTFCSLYPANRRENEIKKGLWGIFVLRRRGRGEAHRILGAKEYSPRYKLFSYWTSSDA
jgi:hypothetical protein